MHPMTPKAHVGSDIQQAAKLLAEGKLVAIPTETVYGLAANAYDPEAVLGIFEAKKRPFFNPLIVHTADKSRIADFAGPIPASLCKLAEQFWPGPLTMLLPRGPKIDPLITAGSPFVAVRIPAHPLTLELLRQLPFPIAAPSANLFGTISPTQSAHVEAQFGDVLAYILDGGPSSVGIESTIVKLAEDERVQILRHGGVTVEHLESVLGYVPETAKALHDAPEAPGMLKSHYAPRIPLVLGDIQTLMSAHAGKQIAILAYTNHDYLPTDVPLQILTLQGDMHEAARNLFNMMHLLEHSGAEIIIAEKAPETGLGIAINDRLMRAAS